MIPEEKWFGALARANDDQTWLAAIGDADEAATQGLLRRTGLPDYELRSERVEAVRQALTANTLSLTDLDAWRQDVFDVAIAVAGINDFRQRLPLVQQFRARKSLPNGDLDTITAEIRGALWRGDVPMREWVEFLDAHRDETDRDLFLYRIPQERVPELQRWLEPEFVITTLHELELDHLRETRGYAWRPADPELVAIDLDTAQHQLRLTWVGWRHWEHDDDAAEERRCVTFLRLNLGQ